jgi:hypothetical protein
MGDCFERSGDWAGNPGDCAGGVKGKTPCIVGLARRDKALAAYPVMATVDYYYHHSFIQIGLIPNLLANST